MQIKIKYKLGLKLLTWSIKHSFCCIHIQQKLCLMPNSQRIYFHETQKPRQKWLFSKSLAVKCKVLKKNSNYAFAKASIGKLVFNGITNTQFSAKIFCTHLIFTYWIITYIKKEKNFSHVWYLACIRWQQYNLTDLWNGP